MLLASSPIRPVPSETARVVCPRSGGTGEMGTSLSTSRRHVALAHGTRIPPEHLSLLFLPARLPVKALQHGLVPQAFLFREKEKKRLMVVFNSLSVRSPTFR